MSRWIHAISHYTFSKGLILYSTASIFKHPIYYSDFCYSDFVFRKEIGFGKPVSGLWISLIGCVMNQTTLVELKIALTWIFLKITNGLIFHVEEKIAPNPSVKSWFENIHSKCLLSNFDKILCFYRLNGIPSILVLTNLKNEWKQN